MGEINAFQKRKKILLLALIFILPYIIYFSFGFYHISDFITADEHFWVYQRVHTYWHSIFSPEKWQMTRLSDKPGVTVALVSGIVLLKEKNPYDSINIASKVTPDDTSVVKYMFTLFRIPILIFNALFSLYLFWIVRKLTGNFWIGFWSFILIMLSPILLGISQITNADALMGFFSTATLLSFVAYLKTEEKKFFIISPILLGMALLTKLVAVIFFPFLFVTAFLFFVHKFPDWQKDAALLRKKVINMLVFYAVTFTGSLVVFAVFMPAVFVDHQLFFDYTIGYSTMKTIVPLLIIGWFALMFDAWRFNCVWFKEFIALIAKYFDRFHKIISALLVLLFALVILNWNTGQLILNPDSVLNYKSSELEFLETTNIFQSVFYQFYPFVFSLTPLAILALLFVWIKSIRKKTDHPFLLTILSLFLITYCAALVAQNLPSTIRYSISLYPIVFIIAGIGIYEFFLLEKTKKISKILISLGVIIVSTISLWQIKPFYFNYTNSLLPKKYSIATAWGYGGYEAAQFLNKLENAKELNVWTDYYGFRNFFVGSSKTDYFQNEKGPRIDYFVLTKQGQIKFNYWCNRRKKICKNKYVPVNEYYSADNPVWEMYIDGRPNNFIKIFKAKE